MPENIQAEVTRFLARIEQGDELAADALLSLLYKELRRLAGALFRKQRPVQTLQPTALVHEAFLKLSGVSGWESRAHFFAVAARAMRQILANHAEGRRALKRGGMMQRVTLPDLTTPGTDTEIDLVELDDALAKLGRLSPRQARIVELRFFADLGEEEIAHLLQVSTRTVERDWRMARAFLECELRGHGLS